MLTPAQLAEEVKRLNLTGVNVTEHDRVWESHVLEKYRAENPHFFVNAAMEVSTDLGHILAVGLPSYLPGIRRAHALREAANEYGAFLIVAHPFRHFFDPVHFKRQGKDPFDMTPEQAAQMEVFQVVDGIEVLNGCNTPRENWFALQVARVLGKPGTGGSDAHSTQGIGYFCAAFEATLESSAQMLQELHAGRFFPAHGLAEGNLQSFYETAKEPV
jgi:predicted metal-dependent phosphoesterase TrpH